MSHLEQNQDQVSTYQQIDPILSRDICSNVIYIEKAKNHESLQSPLFSIEKRIIHCPIITYILMNMLLLLLYQLNLCIKRPHINQHTHCNLPERV